MAVKSALLQQVVGDIPDSLMQAQLEQGILLTRDDALRAEAWAYLKERAAEVSAEALETTRASAVAAARAAQAAQESAKWTKWAAIATAISAVATMVGAWMSRS